MPFGYLIMLPELIMSIPALVVAVGATLCAIAVVQLLRQRFAAALTLCRCAAYGAIAFFPISIFAVGLVQIVTGRSMLQWSRGSRVHSRVRLVTLDEVRD